MGFNSGFKGLIMLSANYMEEIIISCNNLFFTISYLNLFSQNIDVRWNQLINFLAPEFYI